MPPIVSDSAGELLAQFLSITAAGHSTQTGQWLVVWRTFVDSPWYRAELDRCARRAIFSTGAPLDWLEDVKQDAVLLLAQTLRNSPDMNVDRERVHESFVAWIRTIVMRHCQQAIRHMRRLAGRERQVPHGVVERPAREVIERQVQLSLAVDALDHPAREIVSLNLKGYCLTEIAGIMQMKYAAVSRCFREALSQLREHLDAP